MTDRIWVICGTSYGVGLFLQNRWYDRVSCNHYSTVGSIALCYASLLTAGCQCRTLSFWNISNRKKRGSYPSVYQRPDARGSLEVICRTENGHRKRPRLSDRSSQCARGQPPPLLVPMRGSRLDGDRPEFFVWHLFFKRKEADAGTG